MAEVLKVKQFEQVSKKTAAEPTAKKSKNFIKGLTCASIYGTVWVAAG